MAETRWTGASSGSWTTAGNWSAGVPDGSGGSYDPVVFPASSTQAVTADHTAQNAVDMSALYLQRGFNADIGSAGNELYISAGNVYHFGGGALHLKAGDAAVDDVYIDAEPASGTTLSASLVGTGTTDFTNIHLIRGVTTISSTVTTITLLEVGQRSSVGDVTLTKSGTATITTMDMWSGVVTNNGVITTLLMGGGTLTQLTSAAGTIKQTGGLIRWGADANVTTLYLRAGTFDARCIGGRARRSSVARVPRSRPKRWWVRHELQRRHERQRSGWLGGNVGRAAAVVRCAGPGGQARSVRRQR